MSQHACNEKASGCLTCRAFSWAVKGLLGSPDGPLGKGIGVCLLCLGGAAGPALLTPSLGTSFAFAWGAFFSPPSMCCC